MSSEEESKSTSPDADGAVAEPGQGEAPRGPDDASHEHESANAHENETAHSKGGPALDALEAREAATDDVVPTPTGWGTDGLDAQLVTSAAPPTALEVETRAPEKPDEEPVLLEKGNPLRWVRGGIPAGIAGVLAFLTMAKLGQHRLGVPLGFLEIAVMAWGVMDLLGTFDDPEDRIAGRTTLGELAKPLGILFGGGFAFSGALMGGASGIGSQWMWGGLVAAAFLAFVFGIYRAGVTLGVWANEAIHRRAGFWVVTAGALLYFPSMGLYSLWDPWETHYGEVAREILARDDWISLWWAQDGWFWSKPILNFWIQSIAMASLGVHYKADEMLMGAAGHIGHPEWVVRAPNVLMTIAAMYVLYKGIAKVFGTRAGLLGGLVLATMPDWFFLAHQTMTDMPFVAAMTAAMGLLLLGLNTDPEHEARLYEVRVRKTSWRLSAWHLVFGSILVCALPQVILLLTRNVSFVTHGGFGFSPHWDLFRSGSPGNCGEMHQNEACADHYPASIPKGMEAVPASLLVGVKRFFFSFEPALQGIVWAGILGLILYLNWGERRTRRLAYLGAWLCSAIATMGKGPAGFVLPMLCAFAYVCTKKKWDELLRLEILSGLGVLLVVAIPWYLAMFVRHGPAFTDRLIFHDMINRTFSHVHDTNEGDDTSFRFYIWQLGYALFPWTGLAPLGLLWWARRGDASAKGRGDASVFLVMWFLFGFALFSFMGTKFHHYIFPVVPAVAMLVGVVLDDLLPGVGKLLEAGKAIPLETSEPREDPARIAYHEALLAGGAAIASMIVIGLVSRDLVIKPEGADQPGAIRLLQLFTYNYRRPWPDSLDFSKTLTFFGIAFVVLSLVLAMRKLRRYGIYAFVALSLVWAVWGLDSYMVKTAPHWGQRELVAAYYEHRAPGEPLVAYQMNWKGENFYTGNHVPAYVSSGSEFTNWVKAEKEKGTKVMYFVTEHGRVGGLKGEAQAKNWTEMTSKEVCNKFVLMRAEL